MKMTIPLWIVLDLIFPIVFNTFFFVLGGSEHPTSVWLGYGFIHFAYLMLIFSPKLARSGKNASAFKILVISLSWVYFFIELVTGLVFIFTAPESYKPALLTQLCMAGVYGGLIVSLLITNSKSDARPIRE